MKTRQILLSTAIFLIVIFGILANDIHRDNRYNLSKREILMRKIGHEILLHSGDSTSRVLPVAKLEGEKYRLQFEKQFTFNTDTLAHIVREILTANNETAEYIVNVLDCSSHAVIYGYEVSPSQKKDDLACSGRLQVPGCYLVTIEFGDSPVAFKKYAATVSLLAFVILCPLIVLGYRRKKFPSAKIPDSQISQITIGSIVFDKDKKQLVTANETIKLTAKETKILFIFAQQPNEIIDRTRLQKEIWEDDGIIVGRSLDVFISKLRKKLESDPTVELANIHGKGYRLQIPQP